MNVLILKLGATGDVVRTTPILKRFNCGVSWITAGKNVPLLVGLGHELRAVSWEDRAKATDRDYDLVINLEDSLEVAQFLRQVRYRQLFGIYASANNTVVYTDDSRGWFDLSLSSRFGKVEADKKKFENRRTYQDILFSGLGFSFGGEKYLLPAPTQTEMHGDVAIAPKAGAVWPMKNWACYNELGTELAKRGLIVNVLPDRSSLLEHLSDVGNHRCVVSGDSLPMHFALGLGIRCITLFNCTSPWEIFDYGVQEKIVSPLLPDFFFKRGMDVRAVTAIPLESVLSTVIRHFGQK